MSCELLENGVAMKVYGIIMECNGYKGLESLQNAVAMKVCRIVIEWRGYKALCNYYRMSWL